MSLRTEKQARLGPSAAYQSVGTALVLGEEEAAGVLEAWVLPSRHKGSSTPLPFEVGSSPAPPCPCLPEALRLHCQAPRGEAAARHSCSKASLQDTDFVPTSDGADGADSPRDGRRCRLWKPSVRAPQRAPLRQEGLSPEVSGEAAQGRTNVAQGLRAGGRESGNWWVCGGRPGRGHSCRPWPGQAPSLKQDLGPDFTQSLSSTWAPSWGPSPACSPGGEGGEGLGGVTSWEGRQDHLLQVRGES